MVIVFCVRGPEGVDGAWISSLQLLDLEGVCGEDLSSGWLVPGAVSMYGQKLRMGRESCLHV